jgi:hypothetical protein
MNAKEMAEQFRVSERTARRHIARGTTRCGRAPRLRRDDEPNTYSWVRSLMPRAAQRSVVSRVL